VAQCDLFKGTCLSLHKGTQVLPYAYLLHHADDAISDEDSEFRGQILNNNISLQNY